MKEIFSYKFKDSELLENAITHASSDANANYQRLEFLGDRILSLIIADYIYKNFANEAEGELARRHNYLVSGQLLAEIALEKGIDKLIILGKSEEAANGRNNKSHLEDVMEAIIAAIYLDSDLDNTKKIVLKIWKKYLAKDVDFFDDPKSTLQELLQKKSLPLPIYKIIKTTGPSHCPEIEVSLQAKGFKDLTVIAKNRKEAEKILATRFLENIYDK
jgi:ribonuclease III